MEGAEVVLHLDCCQPLWSSSLGRISENHISSGPASRLIRERVQRPYSSETVPHIQESEGILNGGVSLMAKMTTYPNEDRRVSEQSQHARGGVLRTSGPKNRSASWSQENDLKMCNVPPSRISTSERSPSAWRARSMYLAFPKENRNRKGARKRVHANEGRRQSLAPLISACLQGKQFSMVRPQRDLPSPRRPICKLVNHQLDLRETRRCHFLFGCPGLKGSQEM
ncbi:hypothetical protein BDZ88DRAFT_422173 [Geranomyces variabilis]|nr:hypothetical protein BDZ88DRAFT_422173 [Geranomyces variabilis]